MFASKWNVQRAQLDFDAILKQAKHYHSKLQFCVRALDGRIKELEKTNKQHKKIAPLTKLKDHFDQISLQAPQTAPVDVISSFITTHGLAEYDLVIKGFIHKKTEQLIQTFFNLSEVKESVIEHHAAILFCDHFKQILDDELQGQSASTASTKDKKIQAINLLKAKIENSSCAVADIVRQFEIDNPQDCKDLTDNILRGVGSRGTEFINKLKTLTTSPTPAALSSLTY
jgi:hypothetical protein